MPRLVLASTSPYRRALLERLGLGFECLAPEVVEDSYESQGHLPRDLARILARAKAESVAHAVPDAVIVGSDQLVAFEGQVHGKPGTAAKAVEQLLAFQGKSHELITALAVWHPRGMIEHIDVTTLWMRTLRRDEAERYVASDRPLDCAGSYKLEQRGIALFERIESRDHSAITGLPLIALVSTLRELGFAIP